MDQGDLFNLKFKERLQQDKWFAGLHFKKQRLLAKYAQARLFQKEILSCLKETHSVNLDLEKSVKIGPNASVLEAMFFDNHGNDLNFVWDTFQSVQKDMSDGLTPGPPLENFVIASQKLYPAMYGIMEMLDSKSLNSEDLWSLEGLCGGSTVNYLKGLLLQSIYLKSVALRAQGSQIDDNDFKKFTDGVGKIRSKQYSSCSCKFLIITHRFTVNI